jgi:hypothetical protein
MPITAFNSFTDGLDPNRRSREHFITNTNFLGALGLTFRRRSYDRFFASYQLITVLEDDLMKRTPHPDAKPMGAFSIGQRAE